MDKDNFLTKLENINEQLNLTHYWIIFLKYKKILLIIPILFAVLSYLISLQINPIFKSSATLVIEQSGKNIINIQEVYDPSSIGGFGNSNYINNQIQILESDEVLSTILSDEKLYAEVSKLYQKMPRNFFDTNFNFFNKTINKKKSKSLNVNKTEIKNYIKENLEVIQIRNSDVANLSITSYNPELAKFLLESVIDAYLKYDVDTKVKVTNYANVQINLRLSKLLVDMEKAEQKLLN